MMDEAPGRVEAAYGRNYARLLQFKEDYNPANLFRVNHNITRPSADESDEPRANR